MRFTISSCLPGKSVEDYDVGRCYALLRFATCAVARTLMAKGFRNE